MTENKQNNPETVKWMCVLAYIIFFLPLAVIPTSEKGKFHANQGFTLFLLALAVLAVGAVLSILPFIGNFLRGAVWTIGGIITLFFAIVGIINALNGEEKKLPIIGEYTFLK